METLRVFYCQIPSIKGVFVVSGYNPGHAVKLINKKLKSLDLPPLDRKVKVAELDLKTKKGTLALVRIDNDSLEC